MAIAYWAPGRPGVRPLPYPTRVTSNHRAESGSEIAIQLLAAKPSRGKSGPQAAWTASDSASRSLSSFRKTSGMAIMPRLTSAATPKLMYAPVSLPSAIR